MLLRFTETLILIDIPICKRLLFLLFEGNLAKFYFRFHKFRLIELQMFFHFSQKERKKEQKFCLMCID